MTDTAFCPRNILTLTLLVILIAFLGAPVRAVELYAVTGLEDAGRGSLLFKGDGGGPLLAAPLVGTEVSIAVSGLVARAHVAQRFLNPGDGWVEGIYVFPLPENAAVDHLTMRIGERVIEGRIKERREARQIYEAAKQEGRKSGLIESERPNIFTTSIANIGPGEEVTIEIEYQQILEYDQGRFALRFPMVVGPRYMPSEIQTVNVGADGWSAGSSDAIRITSPVLRPEQGRINPVRLTVTLDAGFPLSAIDSPYHAIDVDQREDGRTVVSLADGAVAADSDFELVWTPEVGAAPGAGLFAETVAGARYMLVMVMPPTAPLADERAAVLPREAIFVIDTSGSMEGDSIIQAKVALSLAIDRLKDGDRFNIIQFNSITSTLFHRPRVMDGGHRAEAQRYIAQLAAAGGTAMAPALRLALADDAPRGFLRQVVFLTDGAVGNEDELFRIIRDSLRDSRLFTIGIGSAPNSYFMSEAAEAGRGTFTYIGGVDEVSIKMGDLFAKLENPLLADLEVIWPDGAHADMSTAALGDLYAGEPVIFTVRATLTEGDAILSGRLADRPWRVKLPLAGAAPSPGVAKLWARERIDDLMTGTRAGDGAVRARVVELGIAHHLVTKYTSLVAVDTTPTRPADQPLGSLKLPHNLPKGWDYDKTIGPGGPQPHQRKADASRQSIALASAAMASPVRIGGGGLTLPQTATPAALHYAAALALALFGLLAVLALKVSRRYS